ncbi:hypothetical protein [Alloalcanivorax gelatiniphagus]|uniref:Uncharacterized protein n=1 Tax=Alloalcanivorax gelatiniphagus TaxID=1194167 RepID=A0ABY2XJ04_9GAMM|nr:hypothetical protein [Alloalcanivorax gelatiniphagus]TMW11395.1 hypothetical protein FGS76_15200 [Alloalcanivorax gelatiniphagus]
MKQMGWIPRKSLHAWIMATSTLLFLFVFPALANAASKEQPGPPDIEAPALPAPLKVVLGPLRLLLPEHGLETIAHRDGIVIVQYANGNTLTHRTLSEKESALYKDGHTEAQRAKKILLPSIEPGKKSTTVLPPEIRVRKIGGSSLYLRTTKNSAGYRTMLFTNKKTHYIDLLMGEAEALQLFQTATINSISSEKAGR